ncbi:hypothetical protein ACFFR3_34485 [Nonomuraea salmonea]|uniref:Lipoprotein n=2 Tax=Nonomuraea salmonea TaxID=46181 RepID=A0ABV5NWL1_9ACTN
MSGPGPDRRRASGGRWRRVYGASPWHLVGLAACFAVAGYALTRVVGAGILMGFAVWFVGAIILHDLVMWPLYTAADGALRGRRRRPWLNHVRVPAALSLLLLLVWFPLILGGAEANYRTAAGLSTAPYLLRWAIVTLVLFAGSGLLYAMRRRAAGRPDR